MMNNYNYNKILHSTYIINNIISIPLSVYKSKNYVLTKYHVMKEYIPFYTKNK